MEEDGKLTAGGLVLFLSNVPPDTPVVYREYHASVSPDRLGPDEYDWYGGLPTGEYRGACLPDLVYHQGKVIIDPPLPRE